MYQTPFSCICDIQQIVNACSAISSLQHNMSHEPFNAIFCKLLSFLHADNNFEALKSNVMVVYAVATCSMKSGRDKSVSMFPFAKEPKLRQACIFNCRRESYNLTMH